MTVAPKGMVGSSPGRLVEKLPPAPRLVSLLRGKSGNRSRRAPAVKPSPIFAFRRRTAASNGTDQTVVGEPSSPKVTCIGQVRIHNKKKLIMTKKNRSVGNRVTKKKKKPNKFCCCRCYHCGLVRFNPFEISRWSCRIPYRRWWTSLFSLRLCRGRSRYRHRESLERESVDINNVNLPSPVTPRRSIYNEEKLEVSEGEEVEELEDEEKEETKVFVSSATTTPPMNALLLMRCRSAPHNRSSSLATRFWVSPLAPAIEDISKRRSPEEEAMAKEKEEEKGEQLVVARESYDSRKSVESVKSDSNGDRESKEEEEEQQQQQRIGPVHPLVLMRSKSEPARKAAKLSFPEAETCWKNPTTSGRRRLAALAQAPRPPPLLQHQHL